MIEKIKKKLQNHESLFIVCLIALCLILCVIAAVLHPSNKMVLKGTDNYNLCFYAEANWLYDEEGNIYHLYSDKKIVKFGEMSVVPDATKSELQGFLYELSDENKITKIDENSYRIILPNNMISYILYNEENNSSYQLLFDELDDNLKTKIESSFKFVKE